MLCSKSCNWFAFSTKLQEPSTQANVVWFPFALIDPFFFSQNIDQQMQTIAEL